MVMTLAFAVLLGLHGLIHVLGFAKAFGLAELPSMAPISRPLGWVWGGAALLFLAAAVSVWTWPRGWWALAVAGITLSMVAITSSWADAKFGVIANAMVLVGAVFGFLASGPFSLRAEYERDVRSGLRSSIAQTLVTESDLAHLPGAVQRYLRLAGVVGQPRVDNFSVRMHGRIRSGRDARWMPFAAEQHNFLHAPARLFYLNASMFLIPVQGYHRFADSAATMHVKAAALVPVATASGAEMTRAETVTLFNDMCLFAPAMLIDQAITWYIADQSTVQATFTHAGHTIQAGLWFNEAGELTNFVSLDRYQWAPDGTMRQLPWSTPVAGYRRFGSVRLPAAAEARWCDAVGEYPYIELTIDDVEYNLPPR